MTHVIHQVLSLVIVLRCTVLNSGKKLLCLNRSGFVLVIHNVIVFA